MSKVTLNTVGNIQQNPTSAATTINTNFSRIQSEFDNTLSRGGQTPNQMSSQLDMNSNRILNLPAPVSGSEPFRLSDAQTLVLSSSPGAVDSNSYSSVSAATLANISSAVTSITVAGFAAAGDGGGAQYKKVTSLASGTYGFQSVDGAHWQLSSVIINPRMVGAKGDGTTNDSVAIQNAINTAAATSGELLVTNGNYIIASTITLPTTAGQALNITGTGGAIFTRATAFTNGDLFSITASGNDLSTWLHIKNINVIGGNGALVTAGYAFHISNRTAVRLENILIYDGFGGVKISTGSSIYLDRIYFIQSSTYATNLGASEAGFLTEGVVSALFLNSCGFVGQNVSTTNCLSYGAYIGAADGIQITNSFFGASEGVHFQGVSGSNIDDVYFSNCIIDACRTTAINFQGNVSVSNVFTNIRFAGTHINVRNDSGLGIGTNVSISGNVDFVQFEGCNMNLSAGTCVSITNINNYTGNPRQSIKFIGCDMSANATAGSLAVATLDTGVTGVSFVDCEMCNRTGSSGASTYAVALQGSNSNIRITGCNVTPNVTGTVFFGTGGHTNLVITGNIGIDNIVGSVAAATTVTLPPNPVVAVTGTSTNIQTINNGWTGRKVQLINETSASATLTFVTGGNIFPPTAAIVNNRATEFVYDGTVWRALS